MSHHGSRRCSSGDSSQNDHDHDDREYHRAQSEGTPKPWRVNVIRVETDGAQGEDGYRDRRDVPGGNFFADPLPSADVLIMGHILHDWDLDQKRMLLQKAYDALPDGGALIVYEAIIDDDRRHNAFGLLMSLNMLIEGVGFDYTGADCRGWMADAGFKDSYVEHLVGPDSMVVGIK